jgi:Domain of unknown function (DUF4136)
MKRRLLLLAAAATAGLIGACSTPPSSEARLNDSIVLTKRAPNASFGAYHTFFIRPEIRVLADDDTAEPLDDRYAAPLLDETTEQLVARGYEQVNDKADAELAVELDYVRSVNSAVACYSWWDSYYWGYPAWGYYPYYGGCTSATWRAGTLATMIVDLTPAKNDAGDGGGSDAEGGAAGAGPGQKLLSTIWFSGVYGVESDYTDSTVERARQGIDQAFAQSPYLATSR